MYCEGGLHGKFQGKKSDGSQAQKVVQAVSAFKSFNIEPLKLRGVLMPVKHFEDLEVWKEARLLTQRIYQLTRGAKFSKDFDLRDQIQWAAVSVMSNIAEGFERGGNQEFIQFLYIAKGSCGEVRSQLYVALDQGYMAEKESDELTKSFKRLSVMISNLIDYLKRSGMKGEKFKKPLTEQ
jgi:four helix bundle protein